MAWSMLREKGALALEEEEAPGSARKVITTAVLINLLNPKLTTFFFAFLPQFVTPGDPHTTLRMLELSSVFVALTFAVFALYGIFASAICEQVVSRPQAVTWMRRVFAGSFLALSVKLAFTRQ